MKTLRSLFTAALLSAALITPLAMSAQDEGKPKFQFTPAARVLFDGALYFPNDEGLNDGVAMPDIRIGGTATYGNWKMKIDIGFGYGKIGFKDIFMQYSFNDANLLRLGYFTQQFGLNAATSSSLKPASETPVSDCFFIPQARNLGLMYLLNKPKVFWGLSAAVSGANMTSPANETGRVSVMGLTRFAYRPLVEGSKVVHIGVSLGYQTAPKTAVEVDEGRSITEGVFNFSTNYPTRVNKVKLAGVDVTDAKSSFRVTPEAVFAYGRVALEGQYYYMNVKRDNGLPSYRAQGGYALLRGLLIGKGYTYSMGDGGLACPAPKSLEMVLGYDRLNATDKKAGLMGGVTNDYSVTLTYYINKYMLARLRYSYTDVKESSVRTAGHVNILQARLQFKF